MQRLSSLDAQFLAAEGGNFGAQYCGVAIYRTGQQHPITAAVMRERIAQRLHALPPLRRTLRTVPFALDHPVFVDTAVQLDDHVSETTLIAPADEHTLAAEVARHLAVPLDRDRPLWRLVVIHGLPGKTAVVMTLHHSAVDGLGAGEIYASLLDGAAEEPDATSESAGVPAAANPAVLALRAAAFAAVRGAHALRATSGALAHLDLVPAIRSLPGVHTVSRLVRGDPNSARLDAPRTRFNTKLSAARSVAFGTLSLSEVKAIKNELTLTVNDVVIALCAGALRRRLVATGDLPADPLVAYMPTSTREPGAHGSYGNAIASMIAAIPTHLPDALERLAFTRDALARAKHRAAQAPPTLLSDVNEIIPVPIFGVAARGLMDLVTSRFVRPPVNLTISNVPGSPVGMTCRGIPLEAHYPLSVVFDGFALNITVFNYQDGLDVGIVGDAEALPDAWELFSDMRAELAELVEVVVPAAQ